MEAVVDTCCSGAKSMSLRSLAYLAAALSLNTLMPMLMRSTQQEDRTYAYNITLVFFWAEVLKLCVALAWCYMNQDLTDPSDGVCYRDKMKLTWKDNVHYLVPGFLFFAQNNLSFACVQYYQPSSYQLMMNTRIVIVALLSVTLLRKSLNQLEWSAVVLICFGAIQHNLPKEPGVSLRVPMSGLLVMGATALTAALGNVYTQLVVQSNKSHPIMFQNAQLYLYGVAFNAVNWFLSVHMMGEKEYYGEITGLVVFQVVMFAVYGLTISVILKEFGALVRTVIGALSIVLNGVLDVVVFNSTMDMLDITSFGVITLSVHLYGNVARMLPDPEASTAAASKV